MNATLIQANSFRGLGHIDPEWTSIIVCMRSVDEDEAIAVVQDNRSGNVTVRIVAGADGIGPYTWRSADMRDVEVPDDLIQEALDAHENAIAQFAPKWEAFLKSLGY